MRARPWMSLSPALWMAGGLLLVLGGRAQAADAADEAAQIAVLTSSAPFAEKAEACRALVRTGTAAAVPALARLLDDEQLSHMARYALEPIPDPAVDAALRAALERLSGNRLVGVIGSVGVRRDTAAVEALVRRLRDPDAGVAQAAARALGQIGNPAAAQALAAVLPTAGGDLRAAVIEGLLRSAEALAASGRESDHAQALAFYDSLRALPQAPHQLRAAAMRGAVLLRQDAGVALLTEAWRGADDGLAAAAARTALELPGGAVTTALAADLGNLSVARQILFAAVLGRRGDPAAVPALTRLARQGEVAARVAAVRALGELGDPALAALFLELQKDPETDVARAARETLTALSGAQVDDRLMALLGQPDPATRLGAIELLAQRRVTGAIPALLRATGDADESVRVGALKALAELAGAAQFPALIEVLLKAPSEPTLQAAEDALSAICVREARPAPGRVAIRQALYGKLPEGPATDVTAKVVALVAAGTFAIEASNGNFGDPVPGVVKSMRLEYAVDGTVEVRTVREGETVTITAGAAPPALGEALCAALTKAAPAPRRALIRVLRSARGPAALAAVRAAIADPDPETRNDAVSVLCGWPTPVALDEITKLAENPPDGRAKILALRGCFRLIPLRDAPAEDTLAAITRAFALCERKEERTLGLTALAAVPSPAALTSASAFLDDPQLREEAAVAVLTLAAKLAPTHRPEAVAATTRVAQAGVSAATTQRAKELLEQLQKPPAKK